MSAVIRIAESVDYDRDTGHVIVAGVRWSPEVMASFSVANDRTGEWRGPFWIRRAGDTVVVTNADPSQRGSG